MTSHGILYGFVVGMLYSPIMLFVLNGEFLVMTLVASAGMAGLFGAFIGLFWGMFLGIVVFSGTRKATSPIDIDVTTPPLIVFSFIATLAMLFLPVLSIWVFALSMLPAFLASYTTYLYGKNLKMYLRQSSRKEKPKRKAKNDRLALEDEVSQPEIYEATVPKQEVRKS
ncbi:MAG: hypothetical protein AAFV98_19770 [Chloroflexota bacterium]